MPRLTQAFTRHPVGEAASGSGSADLAALERADAERGKRSWQRDRRWPPGRRQSAARSAFSSWFWFIAIECINRQWTVDRRAREAQATSFLRRGGRGSRVGFASAGWRRWAAGGSSSSRRESGQRNGGLARPSIESSLTPATRRAWDRKSRFGPARKRGQTALDQQMVEMQLDDFGVSGENSAGRFRPPLRHR